RCQTQNSQAACSRAGAAFRILPITAQMAQHIENRFGHFATVAHAQLRVGAKPMRERGISRVFPLQDFAQYAAYLFDAHSRHHIGAAGGRPAFIPGGAACLRCRAAFPPGGAVLPPGIARIAAAGRTPRLVGVAHDDLSEDMTPSGVRTKERLATPRTCTRCMASSDTRP